MRTLYVTFFILIGSLSLSAVHCKDLPKNTTKDDKVIQEERKVETFDAIGLSTSGDVKLVQGSPQKVVVEGSAGDLEKIVTVVEGGKLKLKTKPGSWHIGKITYYITVENIKNLSISGSGSIISDNAIHAESLGLEISGSGSILLADLTAISSIGSHISGSGSIKVSGKGQAKKQEIHISGSGAVISNQLQVQNAEVHISGSGNCKVAVSDRLEVKVSGSGDVYYTGKPVIEASISGSGKLKETTF
jgi:hypothetical protein